MSLSALSDDVTCCGDVSYISDWANGQADKRAHSICPVSAGALSSQARLGQSTHL
jgi:hypothetical protein